MRQSKTHTQTHTHSDGSHLNLYILYTTSQDTIQSTKVNKDPRNDVEKLFMSNALDHAGEPQKEPSNTPPNEQISSITDHGALPASS